MLKNVFKNVQIDEMKWFKFMNVGECPCCTEKGSERGREWKKRKHLGKNYQENKKDTRKI